jgi:hypothetical protein
VDPSRAGATRTKLRPRRFYCGHGKLQRDHANRGDEIMGRDILLWLLGVPISVIILLHLLGFLH